VLAASTEFRPDVIQVEYLQLAYLLRDLRRARAGASGPRLVLSSHEMGSLPRRRRAAAARWPQRRWLLAVAAVWDRLARDASAWADVTLCVTDQDRALLAAVGGRNLVTVPLGIDLPVTADPPGESPPLHILFLGSFQHPPNRSAAALLCDRIWPAVAAQLPGWQLVLAGAGSREFLAQRQPVAPNITALGFVPDLPALLRSCRLLAAPLSEGGGIKIKILEAMAHGLPVVTTPIGAEGIVDRHQELVWWADDAGAFARQLVAAANDPQAAADRAARARRHVAARFGRQAVVARLEAVYRGEASGV
jgi:glycosyltransferase involved in cell wall biosynthesis